MNSEKAAITGTRNLNASAAMRSPRVRVKLSVGTMIPLLGSLAAF